MPERRLWFDLHDESLNSPDVAIVGLPFDGSATFRPGAALAPARLREISATSDALTRRGRAIEGLTVRDFGDVVAADPSGAARAPQQYHEAAASRLAGLPRDSFVIALGGDNSVSIPSLISFAGRWGPDAGVVWFDAHPDLFEEYDGNPDSHACALRRGMALAGLSPQNAVLLATRSFSLEEARFIDESGIDVITSADWASATADQVRERIAARLSRAPAVYLAIDIDGFDSSCAPGTGYPMPGGVPAEAFFSLLERLFESLPIRALDLTEISPPLDSNDVTSFLGAQVILEALGALARARRDRGPRVGRA